MRLVLNLSSALFVLAAAYFVLSLLFNIFRVVVLRRTDISLKEHFTGLRIEKHSDIILYVILIVGLGNIVADHLLGSNQIGAYYENANYTEQYEAEIRVGKKENPAIFCIVTLEHITDEFDGDYYENYFISHIQLPHGRSCFADIEYYPEQDYSSCYLGDYGTKCYIKAIEIADDNSFEILNNAVVSANGEFVASINSDTYHLEDCRHAQKIKRNNIIRFNTPAEADVLGYMSCGDCLG